ncbi:MAG: tRNA-intron lyase [Methanosarcinaceae archaeon]
MIGKLINDRVRADKQAMNELYNTGYYGRPKKDGLELALVEAVYLLSRNRLEIELDGHMLDFAGLFKIASMRQKYFELKYIVYRDLRERGFYVQSSVTDLRVYPRGGHPGKTPARSFVHVQSERVPLPLEELLHYLNAAENVRKQMILAVVDEDSDITYYEVARNKPQGAMETIYPNIHANATFLEDRVVLWDGEPSHTLYENGLYGKLLDSERLQLSLVEGGFLMKNSIIEMSDRAGKIMDFEDFIRKASEIEPEFLQKYNVYEDIRNRRMVAKTGFKFGTHFRVYDQIQSPSKIPHSEYLIHSIAEEHEFTLPVMSRAIRLANSVRKRMLFAVNGRNGIEYIDIGRIKM